MINIAVKKFFPKTLPFALFSLPLVTQAQFEADGGVFGVFLINIILFTNDILIPFIIGIGFLFFVWGMFQYFIMGGADEEKRERGKSLMVHSIIAFVVIIIFFGIVNLITSSTGLEGETIKYIPVVPVPSI